ncbi:B12-binding domain-containing radical SAM protein [Sporomusa malonica]|uniref:Anaerobic Mg-protoporphyrin IX monomethyl ester oxidative cyclase n=1 Tax=Sporomusa malonica TaxID=112901 RepID=A0A1W2CWZ4_9FIRM|nr:radical SAM protein [Sporomusa malonica]SMC89486.1 anaerobic Mg-protoporphyrin IX monomethyl ester oxidative cyclase [Sporomusa malonica]
MQYKILLVHAERYYFRGQIAKLPEITGLSLLASYADARGYTARVYCGEVNKAAQILKQEITEAGVRLVGLYCHFYNQSETVELCKYIKGSFGLPVVVGGPQAVALAQSFLQDSGADAVVRGEGEETFYELAQYFLEGKGTLGSINGIAFLDDAEKVVVTPERPLIADLDTIPLPNADHHLPESFDDRVIHMLTGRGCPFACAFCYEGHNTRTVRYRSVPNVLAELEEKLDRMDKKQKRKVVLFHDDTFTLDVGRVSELCAGLSRLRENHDFVWYCEGHVRMLVRQPQMIPLMLQAGMVRLQIGVESGVQAVLDKYNKQTTLADIEEVIRLCFKAGVPQVVFNIIVGGALETEETVRQSTEFAQKLIKLGPGMVEIHTSLYMPLPNTPMTTNPCQYGLRILDIESFTSMADYPIVETETLSREQIFALEQKVKKTIAATMNTCKEEVSLQRSVQSVYLREKYGLLADWYQVLTAEPHKAIYLTRLNNGMKYSAEIIPGSLSSYRPVRCVNLTNHDGIGFCIYHYRLSALESEVLLHSVGKLTVRQIAERLYPSWGEELTLGEFSVRVTELLLAFERRYWMTFSEF